MEFITDLQRILWHELGHLCVDILDVEEDSNYDIDDFWVSYHKIAISDHKWGGGVKMLPSLKWAVLIENNDKTSFALLGIISGCIFQTIFLKHFLQAEVVFEDCFCLQKNCAGQGDSSSFYTLTSEIRRKNGRKEDFIKFSEIELSKMYYKLVLENSHFLELMNQIILKYTDLISTAYHQSGSKDEFHYHFKGAEFESLKEEVYQIMSATSLRDAIVGLKEKIKEIMTA